jgi:hypothetical protein
MTARSLQVAHLTPVHHIDDEHNLSQGVSRTQGCRLQCHAGRLKPDQLPDRWLHVVGVPTANGRLRRMTSTPWHVLARAVTSGEGVPLP